LERTKEKSRGVKLKGKILVNTWGTSTLPRSWYTMDDGVWRNCRTKHRLSILGFDRLILHDEPTESEWDSLRRSGWDIERDKDGVPIG